jgi:hypothetical protein
MSDRENSTTRKPIGKATILPTPEGGWSAPQPDALGYVGEETDEAGVVWAVYRRKKENHNG